MKTIAQMEHDLIVERLELYAGNKTQTAQSLGITIKTLYNKLHEYGLFDQYKVQPGRKTDKEMAKEVQDYVSKVLDKVFLTTPTARDVAKAMLRQQGLVLQDNDEITNQNGKLIAYFGHCKFTESGLDLLIKPIQAIEFITCDINISDIKST